MQNDILLPSKTHYLGTVNISTERGPEKEKKVRGVQEHDGSGDGTGRCERVGAAVVLGMAAEASRRPTDRERRGEP